MHFMTDRKRKIVEKLLKENGGDFNRVREALRKDENVRSDQGEGTGPRHVDAPVQGGLVDLMLWLCVGTAAIVLATLLLIAGGAISTPDRTGPEHAARP